jgi:Na+-translocating ferredoxin:NAD+ oxidoreductase RnfE subunit
MSSRKSGTIGRNNPEVHSVLAVFFFKGTTSQTIDGLKTGLSTYLALTFGTLLSSQGTEASFETVSPAPPGFPFVLHPA